MLVISLIDAICIAVFVAANPVVIRNSHITLPIAKRFNITGADHVLKADRARAATLIEQAKSRATGKKSKRAAGSIAIENQAVSYAANIGVGQPATFYSLLVDTGSSNTWLGAGKKYVRTVTSVQTDDTVSVTYGSGFFSGNEFTDTVTVGTGLIINQQSIGVATRSQGFQGVDGIIGLGPVDLTKGTLSPDTTSLIPTVTDMLFAQGVIPANEIGISFNPTTAAAQTNGEITFGGTDSSKFTGPIKFAPITQTFPANEFWGIDQTITYGASRTVILSETAGLVDTGTTLILLAHDAFLRYMSVTGATLDRNTGLLRLSQAQFGALQSLFFQVDGTTFEFIPNAQIWPRTLNLMIGGTANNIYLIVNDLGTPSGDGLDFINGFTFLEHFYSFFDTINKRVGLATTVNTNSMIN